MIPSDLRVVQVNCDAAALIGGVRRDRAFDVRSDAAVSTDRRNTLS
jgi:hypothetical protein